MTSTSTQPNRFGSSIRENGIQTSSQAANLRRLMKLRDRAGSAFYGTIFGEQILAFVIAAKGARATAACRSPKIDPILNQ
jgi:hypothetical protein